MSQHNTLKDWKFACIGIVGAVVLSAIVWALVAIWLLGGCSSPPQGNPPPPLAGVKQRTMEAVIGEPGVSLEAVISVVTPPRSLLHLVFGPTACKPIGGVNPYAFLPPDRFPAVGKELQIGFGTTACPPRPAWNAWLLVATRPIAAAVNFTPYGMSGCQLLVQPDNLVPVPASGATGLVRREAGSGEILLVWTPPALAAGMHVWLQLLVAAPGQNTAGFLFSPAVEVVVGSASQPVLSPAGLDETMVRRAPDWTATRDEGQVRGLSAR